MINVIFPIAGRGSRFNYEFKPFLKATEKSFIQHAREPFDRHLGHKAQYIFICTKEQEEKYNVRKTLHSFFPTDTSFKLCLLENYTSGPFETLYEAVNQLKLTGKSFVCDCDHIIDISPILKIEKTNYDIIIPTYDMNIADEKNFAKVCYDRNTGLVSSFMEKEDQAKFDTVQGILGCYLFRDISIVTMYSELCTQANMTTFFSKLLEEKKYCLLTTQILNAEFFGTPQHLEQFRFKRAQHSTIFIDVDGTIINQTDKSVLPGAIDLISLWRKRGHYIVVTTSSSEDETKEKLSKYNIIVDKIITGLPSGPRVLINDSKPYAPFYSMTHAINVDRNVGISSLSTLLDRIEEGSHIRIKEFFHNGHSYAKTCRVIDMKTKKEWVRKYATEKGQASLLQQVFDLQRLEHCSPGLTPKILKVEPGFYDMEYLEDFKSLEKSEGTIVHDLLQRLVDDVYSSFRRPIQDRKKWIKKYISTYITPKIKDFNELLGNSYTYINENYYESLESLIEELDLDSLAPTHEGIIHGDLTLQNIMYNEKTNKVVLIDPAGARPIDVLELELAKLLQSLLSQYSIWGRGTDINGYELIIQTGLNSYKIDPLFLETDKFEELQSTLQPLLLLMSGTSDKKCQKITFNRGVCFLGLFFIRMVPYMKDNGSETLAKFVGLLAKHYLNYYIEKQQNKQEQSVFPIDIYYDGTNIQKYSNLSIIKGFTTNVTLMKQTGVTNYKSFVEQHKNLIGRSRPISLQIFNDDEDLSYDDALVIDQIGKTFNIQTVVKVPVTYKKLIRKLYEEKILINITAVFDKSQIDDIYELISTDNGTSVVVSIFCGRITDTNVDPIPIVKYSVTKFSLCKNVKILWAGCKDLIGVNSAIQTGCHIVTVPETILDRLGRIGQNLHDLSLDTVRSFNKDGLDIRIM